MNLRQLCQWTAATSLVATGALALVSAHTIEKLSQNGDISIDVDAFRKLASTSLSLGRVDDQKLIIEEARLLEEATFAKAEALPEANTAFPKIKVKPAATRVARAKARPAVKPAPTLAEQLSQADRMEIAELEKAVDQETEARVLADVYRRVRFQFVAMDHNGYGSESIAIAQNHEALEYDELPELDATDFPTSNIGGRVVVAGEAVDTNAAAIEVASISDSSLVQKNLDVNSNTNSNADSSDSISTASSSRTENSRAAISPMSPLMDAVPAAVEKAVEEAPTAKAVVMNDREITPSSELDRSPEPSNEGGKTASVHMITTTGLDAMPGEADTGLTTQEKVAVSNQVTSTKEATGPPEGVETPTIDAIPTSPVVSSPSLAQSTEKTPPLSPVSDTSLTPSPPAAAVETKINPADERDYSADVASIYDLNDEDVPDYSADTEESAADRHARTNVQTPHRALGDTSTIEKNSYGQGVTSDSKGISIDWNHKEEAEVVTTSSAPIFVGRPGSSSALTANAQSKAVQTSLAKFSIQKTPDTQPAPTAKVDMSASTFTDLDSSDESENAIRTTQSSSGKGATLTQSAASTGNALTPAQVDLKKCETARTGVEAFTPGAEKESLSVCQRPLTLEGLADGTQARWWEVYGTEKEHWPTILFARPSEISETKRVPMLSNASIRILSVVSHVNTHTGTGILFGEIPKGLEIELLGRSDAPVFLDGGMKPRDASADPTGMRQFVLLNVQPGQPLLMVKDSSRKISGAIPLMVKPGIATYIKVPEPKEIDLSFTILDASSNREKRLANLSGDIIGQSGKMGISDRKGALKIPKVAVFGEYPTYIDVLANEKGYKNRYRVRLANRDPKTGVMDLYFFNEARVGGWLKQLAGGVSPYSGVVAGVVPSKALFHGPKSSRTLRIGTFDKKSSLVPERYLLDSDDQLISTPTAKTSLARFIGVQIPEGATVPTLVDENGAQVWSESVYAQPGVINVVGP